MKKEYIIGTDIGTSGCKSILVDNHGNMVSSATQEYPLYTPHAGWAEQDPLDWWKATLSTLAQIVKNNPEAMHLIKGIGLSGQMHGLVALDKNYQIIRPAFLWNDQRTAKQCQEIFDAVGGEKELLKYTNNSMLPGYTGGKILWLKEEEPYNYEKAAIFLNPKDYIRYKLTGQIATEVSDASGTGLFDVKNRKWNDDLLNILNIPKELLPVCYESPVISGYITKEVSQKTGLPEGIAVPGGGGDAVIQTTGTGLIGEGILGITLGTAGIISMGLNSFQFNSSGRLQIFCNNAPDTWNIMGVTLAAGGSYQWFKNVLGKYEIEQSKASGKDVYAIMDEAVSGNSEAGSKNLIFLPYLSGERCPYADPNARSAFIGLTLRHNHEDMARSVMEGVTFSARQVYELITEMDPRLKVSEVRVSGGGSGSILWRQIVADIFQLPVKTVSGSKEGGAYGAVMVAGTGCGVWPSLVKASNVLKIETESLPHSVNKNIYDNLFGAYKALYPALKNTFDNLSQI